ncbi:MAG: D-xylose ABC transporter ATP-binding protein [Spirochaetes bacterium]|nr:MAG: D-xylose ABC transporter ATP-binding protein [Spirochaetota bacterium]
MKNNLILEMKGIQKAFPGVKVFDNFNFDLIKGEVHCICGENGAGKSTLIKMLSGAYLPDKGTIALDEEVILNNTPRLAMGKGIQTIYQEHNLYPLLNVVNNLFAGNEMTNGILLDSKGMIDKTLEILDFLHSEISPFDIVGDLGSGAQKTVEIARALIQKSKILILDEPTSSFSKKEIDFLLNIIKKLSKEGLSIIYISHHLDEVFVIADRVTVIRDGEKVNTYLIEDLDEHKLINDMVGRDVSSFYKRDEAEISDVFYKADNISGNGVTDVSLFVRKGELLGISGMVGSGRTELAELLFGVKEMNQGEIQINGKKVNIDTPLDAIANRMCFITEDRQSTGLFLDHSLVRNTVIASYAKSTSPFVLPSDDVKISEKYIRQMNVITPSVFQKAMYLSGGNQQKVVLAKWFATDCDLFIFDEPTRGIDVGAKEEIYKIMTELLRKGKSIIMISSDMPELIAMSDRVLVMRNGRIVVTIEKSEINEENILQHSIGGSE